MGLYIKLNIQRFGTTVTASVSETGVDNNNNLSYVYATFTQVAASNTWNSSGSAYYNISCDGKSTGNVSYTFSKGSTKTFSATLGPYYHNQDGSLAAKTVTFVVHGDVNNGNHTLTKSVSFTTIPRYFSSTPSISFRSKTNTSITYNWSTSEACDYIAYHLDGGGAVQVWTGNATSGTFTVSGLTGGTTHSVYATCRRKDSQLSSNSNTVSNITTYKTPTIALSLTASDETSLTIKATPSVAIKSKSWTLKNSGGTTIATSTDTAESHTFTGLSAGTTYTIYVSCVSNDANGAISSSTYNASYTTVAYPTIASVGTAELVIGNAQTISITNPKNRNVTVHMRKEGATSDLQSWTTTNNGNFSFTPTASILYNSIPAAHNANCTYFLTYSTYTSASKTGKYKIKETEAPTFTTSNWSYNVNNTYNALTGNDTSVVIKGYSTVNFTVGTAASSQYGATFTGSSSGYVYNWGDGTVALTKTTTASIAAKSSNVIKVTAYDDRGLSTIAARTLVNGTNYVDYAIPTITSAKTHRANGIDAATTLTLTGRLGYVGKFGANGVTNTVATIKYKTKTASSSTWSSEYNLTGFTVNTSTGEFSLTDAQIHSNGESGGFTVGTKYNVMIIVRDAQGLLGSATYTVDVTDGKIARDVYQDSNGDYHEGINGRADSSYTQKINGSLQITGNTQFGPNRYDESEAGFIYNTHGNMKHKRNTATDAFSIQKSDGTVKVRIYPETGNTEVEGTLTAKSTVSLPRYTCSVNSGNTYNYPYHRIAYGTAGNGPYVDKDMVFDIRQNYNGGGYGRVKVSVRTNSSGSAINVSAKWIYRVGLGINSVTVAAWGTTGQDVYFDIFLYATTWARTSVYLLPNQRVDCTLVNSSEADNTTTSDKKTSVEVYKDVATAATQIRGKAYTVTSASYDAQVIQAYPVGAIYISASATSPASLFGGTWTQIKARFLYAINATSGAGGKDNLSSITGTTTDSKSPGVPSHTHTFTTGGGGGHNHEVYVNGDSNFPLVTYPGWTGGTNGRGANVSTTYNGFRTYTNTVANHTHSGTTDARGDGSSHSHNIPYVAVYVWQRTA